MTIWVWTMGSAGDESRLEEMPGREGMPSERDYFRVMRDGRKVFYLSALTYELMYPELYSQLARKTADDAKDNDGDGADAGCGNECVHAVPSV